MVVSSALVKKALPTATDEQAEKAACHLTRYASLTDEIERLGDVGQDERQAERSQERGTDAVALAELLWQIVQPEES